MSKILVGLFAGSAALVLSAAVSAAPTAVTAAAITPNDCIDATNPILVNSVTLQLSNSVRMAYDCRLADAVTGNVNRVMLGACHPGGSAKIRDVPCVEDTTVTPSTWSPQGCTGAGTIPQSGTAMMFTSTSGGVIREQGMATTQCDALGAGITTLVGELPN